MKNSLCRFLVILSVIIIPNLSLAGTWTANEFLYHPAIGARGAEEKAKFDAGLDRLDARLSKEIWVGDPKCGSSLPAAITAIGTNQAILRVPAGTTSISADLNIPANISLKVERGATIAIADSKTLTINGGLEAGLYQVFSCTGTGKVAFGAGAVKEVYPEWFGAKADGATSDYSAITAAAASVPSGGTLKFLSGRTFATIQTVTLPRSINIAMEGTLLYTGSANEPALVVGTSGTSNAGVRMELAVNRSSTSDWSNEGSIGIKLFGCAQCDIYIRQAQNFTIGVQAVGDNQGFSYNTVKFGKINNNKIGVDLTDAGNGWCNENLWLNGRFNIDSNIGAGKARYGVRITSTHGYTQNANIFLKPSFEIGTGGVEGIPILMEWGQTNEVIDARHEGNSVTFARVSNNSTKNRFSTTNAACPIEDNSSNPVSISTSLYTVQSDKGTPIWCSGPLHKLANEYDGAGAVYIPGLHFESGSSAVVQRAYSTIVTDNYLDTAQGMAVFVNTSMAKRFVIRKDVESAFGGRLAIRCYDATGNILTSAGAGHPYVKGTSNAAATWTTNYGGTYFTGSDSTSPFYFTVGPDVAKIAVIMSAGSAHLRIRSFSIENLDGQALTVWSGTDLDPNLGFATAPPVTKGVYPQGKVLFSSLATAGQPMGWTCVSRKDTAMRIQANAGDTSLEVTSTTSMVAGDIISIVLDDGSKYYTAIGTVTDGDTVQVIAGIPAGRSAPVGAAVSSNRWKAMANLAN